MVSAVVKWLAFYGYIADQEDMWALGFIVDQAEVRVKNLINRSAIPKDLEPVVVDIAAGEFLRRKKTTGSLDGFDLDAAIESIKEGDTSVSYSGNTTGEQRLDALISRLTSVSQGQLARYRRLVW